MDLSHWTEPNPAILFSPSTEQEWADALSRYRGSRNDAPFDRCVAIARGHGARHVLIETRFPDMDYRSEHHAFYARVFEDVEPYAHRLHFFGGDVGTDQTDLPDDHGYIGYVIVRPVSSGLVSRAMLPAPAAGTGAQCAVTETVRGVPFTQQDSRLGACAHAAMWICHYTAVLRGEVERRARADFALLADPSLSMGRAVPTEGLTAQQIGDLMRRLGLPTAYHRVGSLPSARLPWLDAEPDAPADDLDDEPGTWDIRLFAVICWYLNGGYPVIVGTQDHAFTIVGWSRDSQTGRILFTRHDDQRGPYLTVHNPLDDKVVDPVAHNYGPWRTLQAPLPPDLWLEPEAAERYAGYVLRAQSAQTAKVLADRNTHVEDLDTLITAGRLALRTYPILSESFKSALSGLGLDRAHVREYRRTRMPRHVWVVEAIDRDRRRAGQPCVVGEIILDATSSEGEPKTLALRIHGLLGVPGLGRQLLADPDLTEMGGAVG